MEKKRKLPARAAARVEQASKKRTSMPPERISETPAPAAAIDGSLAPVPPQKQQLLAKSIQPGKPLPTVEDPQPDDLTATGYQSLQESGVLAESLTRSRHKWISESIFEKYWSKPLRKKGVVTEDLDNPPKDSMIKLGQVIVTIEPHVFDATIYAVKDPKPTLPTTSATFRPIIQYGPPNGSMPPPPAPPTPSPAPSTPAPAQVQPRSQTPTAGSVHTPQQQQSPGIPPSIPQLEAQRRASSASTSVLAPPKLEATPSAVDISHSPVVGHPTPQTAQPPLAIPPVVPLPMHTTPVGPGPGPNPGPGLGPATTRSPQLPPVLQPQASAPARPAPTPPPPANGSRAPTPSRPVPAPGTDPIIVTLAERATEDPGLRELMKRVAQGDAPKHELQRFQVIIDQITAESRRKGTTQGPSADRLLFDGRTVRYFADEVRAILDIVLSSNPKQTSADLRPPPGSDPLVVLLVKTALDEYRVSDVVRRIAENRPHFNDAKELQDVLESLKRKLLRDKERQPAPVPVPIAPVGPPKTSVPNGHAHQAPAAAMPQAQAAQNQPQPPLQQALRSKGPPPAPKPDISAVVFEFAGGNGDRYRFPKFSILEYLPGGQQIIASFLIVRKGSASEYGGDPALDYYQPVTIRILSPTGRYLETFSRVVAPADEVARYMDDVMNHMTRAEYILLAMRLPRVERKDDEDASEIDDRGSSGTTAKNGELQIVQHQPTPTGVLWTTKAKGASSKLVSSQKQLRKVLSEDEQYQNFITTITPDEMEED